MFIITIGNETGMQEARWFGALTECVQSMLESGSGNRPKQTLRVRADATVGGGHPRWFPELNLSSSKTATAASSRSVRSARCRTVRVSGRSDSKRSRLRRSEAE